MLDITNIDEVLEELVTVQKDIIYLYKQHIQFIHDSNEISHSYEESENSFKTLYKNHQELIGERNMLLSKEKGFDNKLKRKDIEIAQLTKILKDNNLYHLYDNSGQDGQH